MAGKIPNRSSKPHNAKPYDRPKSLFQKVASTLCDMFVPSWMLYDSSQKNNSKQKTEQEAEQQTSQNVLQSDLNQPLPESSYIPERRPCCSSYAADLKERREKSKEYEFSSGHRNENAEENISSSAKTDILSTSYVFQRKSSVRHTVVNGDDHSENSEGSASTSGCSSLVSSHQERRDQIHDPGLQISEEGLERISKKLTEKQLFKRRAEKRDISVETDSVCRETESNLSTSHTPLWFEDRSLNPNKRARPQPSATGRRPSFSLSSFGAPSLSDTRNSANKSYSPFYEGKTVFGGASSNRRMQLLSSMPYQYTRPQNARLNVKEASSSKKEFDYMSSTAKRILQSLEKISSPLEDAKKIPAEGKSPYELAFAARHRMMPNIMALKRQSIRPSDRGPPTKSVLIPSPTVIGKNLEPRISTSIEKKRSSDIVITGSSSSSFNTQSSSASAGGKLKIRSHSSVHHSRKQDLDEVVEVPDLPSVPLPVTKLPTFSFSSLPKGSTKLTTTVTNNGNISSQPIFTFSSPVEHNVPSSSQISCSTEASFTFSSPVIKDKSTESVTSAPVIQKGKYNKKEEQCHMLEPASDLIIGGSVMDVLGKSKSMETTSNPEKEHSSSDKLKEEIKVEHQEMKTDMKQERIASGFGDKFKPEPGSWECTTCLVRNKESAEECASCTSPKPNLSSSNTATSQTTGFKAFATPFSSGSMECDVSVVPIENKSSLIASEMLKAKNDASWQGFGDKFKPAADSWNCSTCMVNNKNSSQQCIACGTSKPQSAKSPLVSQTPPASFGNKFKLPPGSWNCDTCFVPNSSDVTKCIACETPRIVISQIKDPKQAFSGFKFSVPEKHSKSSTPIKFGIPSTSVVNASGTTTTTGFKFGMSAAESKSSESLNFGTPTLSHSMPSSSCVFGNKPLEKIPEPVSTSAKVQTGFSIPITSSISSNLSFGQKPLIPSTPENNSFKFGFQHTNQEPKSTNENSTPVSNSVSLSSTVTSLASSSVPFSSTKPSESLTTVTTTASVFNFGKSPPIMSPTSNEIVVSSLSEESTRALPKPNSVSFNFASSRSDNSSCEGTIQRTSEDSKTPLFGTTKHVTELKPDIGQCVKSEIEQKPNIVQSTPSTFTVTSNVPFSFGSSTKNNSGFVFGTPKTESSQGNPGGFTFSIGSGKPSSETPASGFSGFGAGSISQAATTSTFTFGSGALVTNVTTTTTATTTTSNMFSFGTYSTQSVASAKPDTTPKTTNAPLFSANPQISLPSFGSTLSTPTFGQQSQLKQEGFVFQQSTPSLRFGSATTTPVFRFGAPQEQKPAGFTFGASQEPEQKAIEIPPQKPAFSFGFSSPQGEQKPPTVPQDSNFMFAGNSSQCNEQEKPKSGFNFTFNPPQQPPVFGTTLSTTAITGTVPTFNFTGNPPTAAAFSFSASPSNTPGSRRIKRAVRRSGLASGRRD